MDGKMNLLLCMPGKLRWMNVAIIMFLLKLCAVLACNVCSSPDEMEKCACFQKSSTTTITEVSPTTQTPTQAESPTEEEFTLQRANEAISHLTAQEQQETSLSSTSSERILQNTLSLLPPDVTYCPVMLCNEPRSQMVMADIYYSFSRTWVDKLFVSKLPPQEGHRSVHFPAGWLRNLRVKHFEVSDTPLSWEFIHHGEPFLNQEESMLWFTVSNCHLSGILTFDDSYTVHTKGLNKLRKIEGIDFSRNNLLAIRHNAFTSSTNLSTVILSHNNIQAIGSAFSHIPKLKRLDLSHNVLKEVQRNWFASPQKDLEHLVLSWNFIKVLPLNFFTNMPKLKVVIVSNNLLTSMPGNPWTTVWRQLTFVDIRHNFVLCNCELLWLLPLLSPTEPKDSTTPAPLPLPGQIVLGSCLHSEPKVNSTVHRLTTLTRAMIVC